MVHALKYIAILVFMCLPNLTIFHSISLHPGPAEQFQNWLGMRIKFCKCTWGFVLAITREFIMLEYKDMCIINLEWVVTW